MGVLGCKMPVTGVRLKFGFGFTHAQRPLAAAKKEFLVGAVISYKHQGLTTANGKPRFLTYLRIRSDKKWDDVVADAQADIRHAEGDAGGRAQVRTPSLMEATSPVRLRDNKRKATAAEDDGDGDRGGGDGDGDDDEAPKAQKGKQEKQAKTK